MCGRKNHKEKTNEEERRIIKKECGYKIGQQYGAMDLFILLQKLQIIAHLNPMWLKYTRSYTPVFLKERGRQNSKEPKKDRKEKIQKHKKENQNKTEKKRKSERKSKKEEVMQERERKRKSKKKQEKKKVGQERESKRTAEIKRKSRRKCK